MAFSDCFFQAIKVKPSYPLPVIASLTGTITRLGLTDCVIEVSGVGYLVNITAKASLSLKSESQVRFNIAQIIREDSQALYGFENEAELAAFNLLCSVSGVGPKSALSVIGALGVDGVAQAVGNADDSMFRSVTGVGPKTAKLIVVTLTGKIVGEAGESSSPQVSNVVTALVGLGYQERPARKVVEDINASGSMSESDLLRSALAKLSTARKVVADE